jgi:hypothetical protein
MSTVGSSAAGFCCAHTVGIPNNIATDNPAIAVHNFLHFN